MIPLGRSMRALVASVLAISIAACGRDFTAPVSAHGVSIIATRVGTDANGTTMSIRIANDGSATAYLVRCGANPLLAEEQFVNGRWQQLAIAFMCPAPPVPGPITMAVGESIVVTRTLSSPGRVRMVAYVSTSNINDR